MDKGYVKFMLATLVVFAIFIGALGLRDLGDTSINAYVLTYQHTEYPLKVTTVTFSYGHPKSLVTIETFTRTFSGWEDFELETMYTIRAHRGLFQWYPVITEKVKAMATRHE